MNDVYNANKTSLYNYYMNRNQRNDFVIQLQEIKEICKVLIYVLPTTQNRNIFVDENFSVGICFVVELHLHFNYLDL